MCGIIGYTGKENAVGKIITGLELLEYRGYDSAGICVKNKDKTEIVKASGRVGKLKELCEERKLEGFLALGHTRWATHGAPTKENAHPHKVGKTTIVHNGIIENYKELRDLLISEGVSLLSETDTEVGCAIIDKEIEEADNIISGIREATRKLRGSYALGIVHSSEEKTIYAIRRSSPLVIGKGESGYYLASDITALLPFTKVYYPLSEGEIAILSDEGCYLDTGKEIEWKSTSLSLEQAKKGGYEHFMLKEMYEQPRAIKSTISPRVKNGLPDLTIDGIDKELLENVERIHIVACGSAMHAGLVGAHFIQELSNIPTQVFIASEYRYSPPIFQENTLVIIISQSGETADTLASLRYAREVGLRTLAIVNVVESTIAKEAEYRAYTYAGPEIAVATTKGYTTQVAYLHFFALALGLYKGRLEEKEVRVKVNSLLENGSRAISQALEKSEEIRAIAEELYKSNNIFYIGRGIDYLISEEGSLKLKEISYIHSEAYPAGELKHGTISLIENGTPVIALATEESLFEKTESNIKEVKSRGARVLLICTEERKNSTQCADFTIILPKTDKISTTLSLITVVQLLAYHISYLRGCDIDKPRNLAKSVTVE